MPTRLLITAGPTHEPIDEVRFLGNRSSGRMGLSIAAAACERGLSTTLLLGPGVAEPAVPPAGLTIHRFRTTDDLAASLREHWPSHDVLVMAAAVADYRPRTPAVEGKLRRSNTPRSIELEPTPDLLSGLARTTRAEQRVIGFALEPAEGLLESAREKLRAKRLDAIVANPLETMESDHVEATVLLADGGMLRPPHLSMIKDEFARWLVEAVVLRVAAPT